MKRSNRLLLGVLVLCGLFVVGSLFYGHHVRQEAKKQKAATKEIVEQMQAAPIEEDTVVPQFADESDGTQVFPASENVAETPKAPSTVDAAESEYPLFFDELPMSEETEEDTLNEDMPVSPFGFGPYPEVPVGYPDPDLWDRAEAVYKISPERARDWELRERVCIELWYR